MADNKMYSRYLLDEHPITFHTSLAMAIGLNEAIILQKINLWLNCKPKNAEGRSWIYNSYKSWQEQLPFFSEHTIRRAIKNLVDKGIVIQGNFNKLKMDRTIWYSIDYEKLDKIVEDNVELNVKNEQMHISKMDKTMCPKWTHGTFQNGQSNTNDYTMNTNNDNIYIYNKEINNDFIGFEEGDEISRFLEMQGINNITEFKKLEKHKQDELIEKWFNKE